jgi:amidophosphoribosyltransferase
MDVEGIRRRIGADSLSYISEPGIIEAIGLERTCLACFNGLYPAGHPGEDAEKDGLELPVMGR